MLSLNDTVSKLHLIDAKAEQALRHLGISTLRDLLYYFPRDWQDLTALAAIKDIRPNEKVNLRAKIKKLSFTRSPRRRMHLAQALLEDPTGNILAVWFNQPYLKNSLQEGREYYFSGKAQVYKTLQLQNPAFELVKQETIHTAGIIPQYELTEGLTQKQIRYWLKLALPALRQIPDHLPSDLKTRLKLLALPEALKQIHFPDILEKLKFARARLAFDELFLFQLALQAYKNKLQNFPAPCFAFDTNLVTKFVQNLPFTLTNSQRLATWEILQDLTKPHPMNRLLQGEVGSGKTVVAGIAMLEVAHAGFQSVLLAPTEILAWQHYQTLEELFKHTNLEITLLTRSQKINIRNPTSELRAPIIIGTHALLQEHVSFKQIGLLVVDEQHRFGVKQRAYLTKEQGNLIPHLLSMSATPIPRTLALALYGDLDISELKELPMGRKKIITRLVEPDKRAVAYEFIRKKLAEGQQMYVITPLIEESDKLGAKAASTEAEKLQAVFPEFQISVLHGRMKGEDKKEIMERFQTGQIQILVSTTVVEVGMDVPNATIMLIENAERFGLSQLHQLRGRVGRSDLQSYCLLFADDPGELTRQRLEAVVNSNSGFELAEKDLKLRGSGEILGTRQSGFVPFKIAKLSDRKLIKLAQAEAKNLLTASPQLTQFPLLKQKAEEIAKDAHLE